MQGKELSAKIQSMLPAIRTRLTGTIPPSSTEARIVPIDISNMFNVSNTLPSLGVELGRLKSGPIHLNKVAFDLKVATGKYAIAVRTGREETELPSAVAGIRVAEAVTSLVFLHAAARRATNKESFRLIWDPQDTADLLGWYEIVYEDGFTTTIPIRYGVNILEWDWDKRSSAHDYCYGADPLAVGSDRDNSVTFFAFEWVNPRLGKVIEEVRLKGTMDFRGGSEDFDNNYGPVIRSNAVILRAISMVRKRS
jgi:hypothetical protein